MPRNDHIDRINSAIQELALKLPPDSQFFIGIYSNNTFSTVSNLCDHKIDKFVASALSDEKRGRSRDSDSANQN